MAEKKSEVCPVFSGKGYAKWKQRLKLLFAREGIKSVLRDSDNKKKYVSLNEKDREEKMADYNDLQDKARCLIFERLDNSRIRHINPSLTARQMIAKLDTEYAATLTIGLMVKRDK
jgi:hypothetical protein